MFGGFIAMQVNRGRTNARTAPLNRFKRLAKRLSFAGYLSGEPGDYLSHHVAPPNKRNASSSAAIHKS